MDKPVETLGDALKARRAALGHDQLTVAAMLGESSGTISRWEADLVSPKSVEKVQALAAYLDLTSERVAVLIGGSSIKRMLRELRDWTDRGPR